MTRLGVLSDIHGNLPALEAVIDDMAAFAVDHVVVAGDSVNWGPFSRQVMEMITRNQWAVIRGNNEYYLLDYDTSRAPRSWSAFTMPPMLHGQLGDRWTNIIASLPDTLSLRFRDAPPIRVVHGIPSNPWIAMTPQMSDETLCDYLAGVEETTIIGGHSHIAMDRQVDLWHVLNPGSVGVPLDGNFSASYMVIEGGVDGWKVIAQRRVPFDVEIVLTEFERQRFVERCGVQARLVVEEFRSARLRLDPFVRWMKAQYPDAEMSDPLLDEFLQSDVEAYMPEAYRVL
jgi:predicted phosphodiesterase